MEHNDKAISGIKAVPALNYSALLTVLNQLKKQEVKDEFDVVIIDTMDAMFYITENEVLRKNGVTALNDIPYGLSSGTGFGTARTINPPSLRALG